ncbi:MAG: Pyridine nucleotide-disulfide oxidoreductase [Candidatus Falkowbacteria bacterium GW2011_GWC2_38_22]|uniref:Pyridine nucleotide-disulfide oxidoreductase n=1 Tax=Candidatus Falkowbacteria bacterium GW2011_GWE1_38_31 TaxID=1618638 RepID=A0A0G0MAH4_9BACT|nr:MAG: Pyridine nucleotide-disulfide oxidoreductase [Candidatus Falkowbacteria bacterium GW2011_GWF2_38_1205]KKQ61949.1 MAG: Pyridine nucleotide-disulfide oxidoreductase [Candidatus Falkowbacteria bacterium GW2011_GWC2_38_22]KKQ63889.1 MAG: Pyridine nucleotide-disulfide oxidoreductase [Candidatus Falkowbacteria bacterium GW2011_GWF1_38_22]KKQ66146.1 MAG: Pyridine nucleotide-disulfide oxidoreductase [Candidatus Falkowbacteria bacterium GW2011_GWE2_38_254]KKQ70749.1 MAG: Pyridine nucleotide-disu
MTYDIVIIGGGPAGMMAAARASERGARVLVLEKNESLGKKLLATGHGRCNLSNVFADDKNVMPAYGVNYKFLFSVFDQFGVEKTLDFFHGLGLKTKVEDNGRIFPESDRALDVRLVLAEYLKKNNVTILFGSKVKSVIGKKNKIEKIVLEDGKEIVAKNYIIATGGKSYPGTGSTGDAYEWLAGLGHKIIAPRPALTSVIVKEKFVKDLEGTSLKDVGISIFQNKKKIISRIGDLLFTADGLSGPVIIDLSRQIGALLSESVFVKIDLFPAVMTDVLEKKIQNDFHNSNNKMFKNYLAGLVSPKLVPSIIKLSGIFENKLINSISKEERKRLVLLLKEFCFTVSGLGGFEKAMVTAGGVDIKEVDPKTMRSRLYNNLFLAGEVLDLDGPSGGYNLQICWSTGYVAGENAVKSVS